MTVAETAFPVPERGAAGTQPASRWEQAFVSGNGRMGALVFGEPIDETILVCHCRLFLPTGSTEIVPDIAEHLPELRRIIGEQGHDRGMAFAVEKGRERGYPGFVYTDPFHPGFELKIAMEPGGAVRDYLRTEDFQTGEVAVRWRDERGEFERKLFVSRPDNVVVLSLGGGTAIDCDLHVPPIPDAPVRTFILNHRLPKDAPEAAANALIRRETETDRDGFTLHHVYREGKGGYDAAIEVIARGGSVDSDGQKIRIRNAAEALVRMRIEPFGEGEKSAPEKLRAAVSDLPADYDALLQPHARAHSAIFDRVTLDLGGGADRALPTDELLDRAVRENTLAPALLEKIYDAGRYVFLCSGGEERPPNLQGIWTGTWQPAWSGDYTTNTNLQLAVASAFSAAMIEPMAGYFRLIEESLPEWRLNARNLYGARGVLAPSRQSNTAKSLHWGEIFHGGLFWTCGAGWMARWFYEHYLYTGDREFLARRAVPLIKEVAAFYEDFLFEDEAGRYRFRPSYSAENGSADNATQDIAVAKEVLTSLIAACEELNVEQENIPRWREMLSKMPPYLVNDEGALQEWAIPGQPEKHNHRHMSHLYPLFQSYELSPEETPELWKAAEIAFEKRAEHWLRNPEAVTTSSHGRMHMALSAARLGRGDAVWDILKMMAVSRAMYPSLVTAHYADERTFNVDANGAIPEVLHNCLIFALPGRLDLLPALPPQLPRGEIRGLLARGQLKIERLRWEPGIVELELVSGKDQTVRVRVPKASDLTTFDVAGEGAEIGLAEQANARDVTLPANRRVALRANVLIWKDEK